MPTFVIDSAALSRNMEKLRRFTSAQIIAVVKGTATDWVWYPMPAS